MEEKLKKIEEQKLQVSDVLEKLNNKNFNIYFFTLDTKGNPTAGIANIYEHVKLLTELGYNAYILHEKNDYKLKGDDTSNGVSDWLGEEYANLKHVSIESQTLNISPVDFIVIPEIFANIMDQLKGFPCKKIVMSQSYDYLFELLPIGKRWNVDYGFNDVITTSETQADFIRNHFPSINTHVVPVSIPSYFKDSDKPKKPIIAIQTRNQADSAKLVKSFYLQYPMYKWLSFKDLRGLSRKDFASELAKCCLAVWVDDQSGFGTFPLEAMECNTPVIGKIPNLVPEWMETIDSNGTIELKNNGVWTNTTINIPELIANYMKIWLEDSIPQDILNSMADTRGSYSEEKQKIKLNIVYSTIIENRKNEFQNMLSQLLEQEAEITNTVNK